MGEEPALTLWVTNKQVQGSLEVGLLTNHSRMARMLLMSCINLNILQYRNPVICNYEFMIPATISGSSNECIIHYDQYIFISLNGQAKREEELGHGIPC